MTLLCTIIVNRNALTTIRRGGLKEMTNNLLLQSLVPQIWGAGAATTGEDGGLAQGREWALFPIVTKCVYI